MNRNTEVEIKNVKPALQQTPCYMPLVLDVCCGAKGMWFDKQDARALYLDRRCEVHKNNYPSGEKRLEVKPDIIGDFTDIKQPDNSFHLVVFDPPHIKRDTLGEITKRYGALQGDWKEMLRKGFAECFRVLKPNGVLVFKWCEVQFPIKDILKLTDEKPLFGHKSGKKMETHWVCFMKCDVSDNGI
jgi:23S rRNA G2069 N7-methylase RlmK/C1962 C5-methylase RlmI